MAEERKEFFDIIDHYIGKRISDESAYDTIKHQFADQLIASLEHKTPQELQRIMEKLTELQSQAMEEYRRKRSERELNTQTAMPDLRLIKQTIEDLEKKLGSLTVPELKERIAQNAENNPVDEDEEPELTNEEKLLLNKQQYELIIKEKNRIYIEHETAKVKLYLVNIAINIMHNKRELIKHRRKLEEEKRREEKRRPPEGPRRR